MAIKNIKIKKIHDNHIGLQNSVDLFIYTYIEVIYLHNYTQIYISYLKSL